MSQFSGLSSLSQGSPILFKGGGGGGGGSRKRSASSSLASAASGASIASKLRSYVRQRRAARILKNQRTGRQATMQISRSLYSNYDMSTGDNRQAIYIQTGIHPFRIINGANNFVNADNYQITFTPRSMLIHWYLGAALQNVYSYNIPDFAELSQLFDQLQIAWVEIEWFYGNNDAQYQGVTSTAPPGDPNRPIFGHPMHIYAKDYNDEQPVQTITNLAQYEDQKCWQMGQGFMDSRHTVRIRPKLQMNATDDATVTTGVITPQDTRKYWLSTTNGDNVRHYGIKGMINLVSTVQNADPANTYILGVLGFRCTYHYRFKSVK